MKASVYPITSQVDVVLASPEEHPSVLLLQAEQT